MDTRNTATTRRRRAKVLMSKSISSAVAFVVFLLLVSLLTSPASAAPLSTTLMGSAHTSRITIPDHSAQVGYRLWGGRKLMSVVHTDDYNPPGASSKHDPSTGT